MERFYKVKVESEVGEDRVVYRSTSDSPHHFLLELRLEDAGRDTTRIHVNAEMKAGLMADILGKGDFRSFIEELVEKGIAGVAKKMAVDVEGRHAKAVCTDCLLYDTERRYCYALRATVNDPEAPPCEGRYHLSRRLILGVEE